MNLYYTHKIRKVFPDFHFFTKCDDGDQGET